MAATEDDEGQHGKARNNNISQDRATTSNKVLPAPLMDGGQGEMQNSDSVLEDGDDNGGAVGDGDDVKDGDARTADNNHDKEATDNKPSNLIVGILLPTKATRGRIHPSNRPRQTNGVHLRASETTPTPQPGDTLSVNGFQTHACGKDNGLTMRVPCRDQIAYPAGVQNLEGLDPPILEATGDLVRGADTNKLCLQNKR